MFSPWLGEGDPYIKRTGVLVIPFRGKKAVFIPLREKVHSRRFCGIFKGIEEVMFCFLTIGTSLW